MKEFNVGIIGLGCRGKWWTTDMLPKFKNVNIVALCDTYEDRVNEIKEKLVELGKPAPKLLTTDYKELVDSHCVEVVMVFSAWSNHIASASYALRAGKPVAMEVGGCYEIDQCWELVRAYEETKTPIMMLENCCFGENELMGLNMVRGGLLGDIVHCDGAYVHDLREEVSHGNENRHYRFYEYKEFNGENYPTHEIGPIAKVLNINNGNRFKSLVSVSSRAAGLHEYICDNEDLKEKYGDIEFSQGDVVNTIITCEDGSTVSILLDTTLPHYYTRDFTLRGTKGYFEERTQSVFLGTKEDMEDEWHWSKHFGNWEQFREEWQHPIWKNYKEIEMNGGHGGMDFFVMDAFFTALEENRPMPIDVYDAATWMVITALSIESIKNNSCSVEFPDFTQGKWKIVKEKIDWKYAL